MRNTLFLKAGLILIFSILSTSVDAQNPSKRKIEKYKLPDGPLLCLVPPLDVLTTANTRSADLKIQDIPKTTPEITPSRKWQVVPIQSRDQDRTVLWDKSWKDISWSGSEGWLCGAIDIGGGGPENRSVWAVGKAGIDGQDNSEDRTHGAIYHLTWPENKWEKISLLGITFLPGQSLNDILLTNYETVFAIGDIGLILRGVKAGGKWTWASLAVPTKEDLNSLAYVNGALWVACNAGVILESRDDGKTWISTSVKDERGKAPNLQRIHFFDDTGWVVGDGVVLRTMQP